MEMFPVMSLLICVIGSKKNGDHNSSSGVKVSCGFDIKELDMCIYFILQRSAKILFLGCDVV